LAGRIGDNLGRILFAWTELFRTGTTDGLKAILDETVVWEGPFRGEMCHNRDEVLGMLGRMPGSLRITRIEAEERGDVVVVTVDGPDFGVDDPRRAGPRSIVFTFQGDRVTRMKSTKNRAAARRLLGGSDGL